jgi:ergothioneine biosynthesis protein EgtB
MPLGPLTTDFSSEPGGSLGERFCQIRALTRSLVAPLAAEDCAVQSMPDASPVKWHLAHTSWFFEQFVLQLHLPGYRVFHEQFAYLFNSYYESVGPRHQRPERGLLTRPALAEVLAFREHVDAGVSRLLARGISPRLTDVLELGLQHEQQHQELILMDVKHLLSCNPLKPAYKLAKIPDPGGRESGGDDTAPLKFYPYPEGIYEIGHAGEGFCFDNETPRHRVYLNAFELANRPVANGEYLEFIRDRGYERPELWLADGWTTARMQEWARPLYWSESLDAEFTLGGMRALELRAPVCHLSFYEAEAFARWAQARLPTEAEWEVIASREPIRGNFLDDDALRPRPARGDDALQQLFGDVWEWTRSDYAPYPGFHPLAGALGEYNGKFMLNQRVLRGGSCVTPRSHMRATYRNFFYPHMRWQFAGIRLAKDVHP